MQYVPDFKENPYIFYHHLDDELYWYEDLEKILDNCEIFYSEQNHDCKRKPKTSFRRSHNFICPHRNVSRNQSENPPARKNRNNRRNKQQLSKSKSAERSQRPRR